MRAAGGEPLTAVVTVTESSDPRVTPSSDIWPVQELELRTPRLEVRAPTPDELFALVRVAGNGPLETTIPFLAVATDSPVERARRTLQTFWSSFGSLHADSWQLHLVALQRGQVVGMVNLRAQDLAGTHEVATGSWVVPGRRDAGVGTEMRAAVLHLAFGGLGARWATSEASLDNGRSLRVSEKLGYRADGLRVRAGATGPEVLQRLRLTAQDWSAVAPRYPVEVTGLEACRSLLGAPTGPGSPLSR
jgi:RimJ/RimL family protein N-acetyltransferase